MKYEKPIINPVEELAEGVFAASGDACYSVVCNIHQTPQIGRGDYRIQINAQHAAADSHHSGEQILKITFNQPVVYKSSNGNLISGDGTNYLVIQFSYHNNAFDNIGEGDLVVESETGLSIIGAILDCNHNCEQH